MTSKVATLVSLVLPLALASACSAEPPPVSQDAPNAREAEPATTEPAVALAGQPKIGSPEATFEFGTLRPHEQVTHVFTIENQGDADLHIERVRRT